MSLQDLVKGCPELLGCLAVDRHGRATGPSAGDAAPLQARAAGAAAAVAQLTEAGQAFGLSGLWQLQVRLDGAALLVAVQGEGLLLAAADPRRTAQVEKVLEGWQPGAVTPGAAPASAASAQATAAPVPAPAAVPPPLPSSRPARPAAPGGAWSRFRAALSRGHVVEATAELQSLEVADSGAAGEEPLPVEVRRLALQRLLQGAVTVQAGDTLAGGRALREAAEVGGANRSVRWLGTHGALEAALLGGDLAQAGALAKEALEVSKELDEPCHALTQLRVAELLALGKDATRALPWLTQARGRFARTGDAWGLGQALLGEARVELRLGHEAEAVAAARQAGATDAGWDGPSCFLARLALARGDQDETRRLLQPWRSPQAGHLRAVADAVRRGALAQADAAAYLAEEAAPASAASVQALERIAKASPFFPQARETLAWTLLRLGRSGEAAACFRELLARDLPPVDRAAALRGLALLEPAEAEASAVAPPRAAAPAAPTAAATGAGSSGFLGGPGTTLAGALSDQALPDLLEFLRSGRRTGLLTCTAPQGSGFLLMAEGFVAGAAAPGAPRLGQLLVASGRLPASALEAGSGVLGQDPPDHRLAAHLVRIGLLRAEEVRDALAEQATLVLRELLAWRDGAFAFDKRSAEAEAAAGGARVDVQGILMRVFQEQDEAGRDGQPAGAGA